MGRHRKTNPQPVENLATVNYAQAGTSVNTDELGMREMQARAYAERGAQYLLLKAPPASGKSRALMFIALDKLFNQGLKKVIVAVPERSIGGSFSDTNLTDNGFFADWHVRDENNLCKPGTSESKVQRFIDFMGNEDAVLVCTHATLRYAFGQLDPTAFDNTLVAVDEFHHVSQDLENNRLGKVLRGIMDESTAHIVAMTGSYFRGDTVPVLSPEDEEKFTAVTYNYYDQLNGYKHLKSLGIGHHFYQGRYTDAIGEVLDLDKKTIIHIPNVNSGESTKDKLEEVGTILDVIGETVSEEADTGIISVRRRDTGEVLRVADLVDDTDEAQRANTLHYLTTVASKDRDAVDIIIALGMAKEGFDWPFAEHALTVGYRNSLTEIIQIIGRVTRDSEGKTHAQFTNLLAEPDASRSEVTVGVNNMLKAITASLLMEQVLAPNYDFAPKSSAGDMSEGNTVKVKGLKEVTTPRVQKILDTDMNDLKANILQNPTFSRAALSNAEAETANKVIVPKIIKERYPDLTTDEVDQVRQRVVADSVLKAGDERKVDGKRFLLLNSKFINIEDLSIDLIDSINPFQRAYEVMSKSVTPTVLQLISDSIATTRTTMSDEEAIALWESVQNWAAVHSKSPDRRSEDPEEARLGEALIIVRRIVQEHQAKSAAQDTSADEGDEA